MKNFVMKDLCKVKSYIGMNIDYDEKNNIMKLSQKEYIESLADNYDLNDVKLYNTPMEENSKLNQAEVTNEGIEYRNLIGELLYISTGTRPDIAYSVNSLSRFQNCYDKNHYKYALKILKYLVKTKELNFIYRKNDDDEKLDSKVIQIMRVMRLI